MGAHKTKKFLYTEDTIIVLEEEKSIHQSYPSVDPVNQNNDCLCETCPMMQQWH